jgi:SAM-dependent methyltransferase
MWNSVPTCGTSPTRTPAATPPRTLEATTKVPPMAEQTWSDYYDADEGRAPRGQLLDVLARFAEPGNAVDLGCGSGIDTLAMLEREWTVLAIDAQPEAIERLRARAGDRPELTTAVSEMEVADLSPADLVWASYSLFFCDPGAVPRCLEPDPRRGPAGRPLRRRAPRGARHLGARRRRIRVLPNRGRGAVRGLDRRALRGRGERRRGRFRAKALAPVPRDRTGSVRRSGEMCRRPLELCARDPHGPRPARQPRRQEER